MDFIILRFLSLRGPLNWVLGAMGTFPPTGKQKIVDPKGFLPIPWSFPLIYFLETLVIQVLGFLP